MIEIRQATVSDKKEIFDFLFIAYQDLSRYKFPERWEWEYQSNPFVKGPDLPVWIAVENGTKIVGQICVMVEPLKIGAQTGHFLSWAVDLIVLPEYREQKIGFKLTKAIYDANENIMALPMSAAFRHYLEQLGTIQVDTVRVFNRMVHVEKEAVNRSLENHFHHNSPVGSFITNFLRMANLSGLLCRLINAYISLKDFFYGIKKVEKRKIEEVTKFDQKFDEFWETVSSKFDVIVPRDSVFLNWKYSQQPFMNYRIFTVVNDGRMSGYVILRLAVPPESNTGIIADLLVSPEDDETLRSLLRYSVNFFKSNRVRNISAASSIPTYQKTFLKAGFRKQKEMQPLLGNHTIKSEDALVTEDGAWFLGRSDHDWDQYPYS